MDGDRLKSPLDSGPTPIQDPSPSCDAVNMSAKSFDSVLRQRGVSTPTKAMENYAATVLTHVSNPSTGEGSLFRFGQGQQPLHFKVTRSQRQRDINHSRARRRVVVKAAESLVSSLQSMQSMGFDTDNVLTMVAKKFDSVLLKKSETELDGHQCIALRDHMKGSTNSLYRMKQTLGAFIPGLSLLPNNIRKVVGSIEQEGVVPSTIVSIPDCSITKLGNKRGMCNFYYCTHPMDLLALMMRRMFMDGGFRESSSFCSLANQLVVSVGFDKSDTDFIGTWRVCNRHRGNSSLYVQSFACLEGPVAENYENEVKTIRSPKFPVKEAMQALVDDHLFGLTIMTQTASICSCFVFRPTPVLPPVTIRQLSVTLTKLVISESLVDWNQNPLDDIGHPATLPIPLQAEELHLSLITSANDSSVIVGLQISHQDFVAASWRLRESFGLAGNSTNLLIVKCHQISGHVSNDGKQINILSGQGTCTVGYPMPCCMVPRDRLGTTPRWLMIMFL